MKLIQKISPLVILFFFFCLFFTEPTLAQCPMCKAAAESNLKEGGTTALGLNAGIIYLFLTPYLLVAIIGFIWWRRNRDFNEDEAEITY